MKIFSFSNVSSPIILIQSVFVLISYLAYKIVNKPPFASVLYTLTGIGPVKNVPIHGYVDERYNGVYDIFKRNFEEGLEAGAGFAVYVGDEKVISLQGGWQNTQKTDEFNEKTLQIIYSASKTFGAIVIAQLVDQGLLSYDERISTYWPEFAQGNKENVTLMDLMRHRAGVPGLDKPLSLEDAKNPDVFSNILARQPHLFDGKKVLAYHGSTQGFYQNEIVRRVTGKTIGEIAHEFNEKYKIEWYFKPDVEGVDMSRIGDAHDVPVWKKLIDLSMVIINPFSKNRWILSLLDKSSLITKVVVHSIFDQFQGPINNNNPATRSIEAPSYSAHTNADSIAKLAAMMANEGKAIVPGEEDLFKNPNTFNDATKMMDDMDEKDLLFPYPLRSQRGGFLVHDDKDYDLSDLVFEGGVGIGGAIFYYNRKYRIGIGYVANHFTMRTQLHEATGPLVEYVVKKVIELDKLKLK